ncbi:hypothetical protein HYV22_04610 [Candidatus Gottesmanbacteria bacterium]|nr:hypothetical protein [Candidatus Gottesmanbacteria bacterium]
MTIEERLQTALSALETIAAGDYDHDGLWPNHDDGCTCVEIYAKGVLCEILGHVEGKKPVKHYSTKTMMRYFCDRCGIVMRREGGEVA